MPKYEIFQYCKIQLSLVSILVVFSLFNCSEPRTYDIETLNSDLKNFKNEDKKALIDFANSYESRKNGEDSIYGIPVVLVKSLSYKEILQQISEYRTEQERKLAELDKNSFEELKRHSLSIDTVERKDFESPIFIFTQDEYFTPSFRGEVWGADSVFDIPYPNGPPIIISNSIAQKLNVKHFEAIRLNQNYTVVGILETGEFSYPHKPTYFAIISKRWNYSDE